MSDRNTTFSSGRLSGTLSRLTSAARSANKRHLTHCKTTFRISSKLLRLALLHSRLFGSWSMSRPAGSRTNRDCLC